MSAVPINPSPQLGSTIQGAGPMFLRANRLELTYSPSSAQDVTDCICLSDSEADLQDLGSHTCWFAITVYICGHS